jgi:hypothetical protein
MVAINCPHTPPLRLVPLLSCSTVQIEDVFGGSFNTNGLGAVLTCGVTGMKAGLSHSPTTVSRVVRGEEASD